MKKIISILIVAALTFSCMSFSVLAVDSGTIYYVDSENGSDSYSGLTPENAWKTAAKASEKTYSAGDKILFKCGGVYTDTFIAKGNGTKENPITVSSYGDLGKDGFPLFTTEEDKYLIYIHNVNSWCVENIELTAPNGKGIYVIADSEIGLMSDITVKNCTMHNVYFKENASDGYSPVFISSYGKNAILEDVTLSDLNIYDCGRGVTTFGITIEWHKDIFVSPEVSYNKNFLFENISMNNILYDGIIITSINGLVVRNCSLIKTAIRSDWPTAPMWSHHAKNMLIENCEIAGSTNPKDSMAIDFDGWTTDSTCQYIYSHDNVRFIRNCVYDDITKNANCTVRYCLSVNDNKMDNSFGQLLTSGAYDYTILGDTPRYMDNFKFYNNTIINGSEYFMAQVANSYVANNIFYNESDTMQFIKTDTFGFDDDDNLIFRKLTSVFSNNCFYGYYFPIKSKDSMYADPLFTGTDFTDSESFRLASNSPLIGKGIQVEEDMGEHDFYGNKLTNTHNIGCYDAAGVEDVVIEKTVSEKISDFFSAFKAYTVGIFKYIIGLF